MAKASLVWLTVFALLGTAIATPVPVWKDLHETSLDLYAVDNKEYGRFAVRVERVDEVVDVQEGQKDSEGTVLAARVHDVIVMFDVSRTGEVSVNGVPVPVGMSNLKIEADVVTGITDDGEKAGEAQVKAAFDKGLIGMKVNVEGQTVRDGDLEVTRVIISEQITEMNGMEVAQESAIQQVVEVRPDGSIIRQPPSAASPDMIEAFNADGQHRSFRGSCMKNILPAWMRSLSPLIKTAIVVGLLLVVAPLFAIIVALILVPKSSPVVLEENTPFIAVIAETSDEKLPAYTSDGYTAVDTKEEKKAEEESSQ